MESRGYQKSTCSTERVRSRGVGAREAERDAARAALTRHDTTNAAKLADIRAAFDVRPDGLLSSRGTLRMVRGYPHDCNG